MASSSACVRPRRPSARWAPIERAPSAAARAAGRGCARARGAGGPPRARAARRASPRRAPRRRPPCEPVLRAACAPSPGRRPTAARRAADAGTRARAPSGTTSSPSGFATPLATFARNFVRATPTVIGSPTSSRTSPPQPRGDRRAACPRSGSSRARRGTPRRSRCPPPAASCLEDLEHRLARLA